MRSYPMSLPSNSPRPSPPPSPAQSHRPPRSVSWSLPSASVRTSASVISNVNNLPNFNPQNHHSIIMKEGSLSNEDPNTPEFLDWRRLQLAKAKLSGIGEMSSLLAGFSIVATVELQINDDANPYLLTAFAVTTALLVCTTMMSIMISTCILPHIIVVDKLQPNSKPSESPHDRMMFYIDLSWILANTFSIFFFTLDVILLSWIKFTYFSIAASWCATAIMIPVLLSVCVIGVVFYRKVVKHQYIISDRKYQELEEMKRQLDASILHV